MGFIKFKHHQIHWDGRDIQFPFSLLQWRNFHVIKECVISGDAVRHSIEKRKRWHFNSSDMQIKILMFHFATICLIYRWAPVYFCDVIGQWMKWKRNKRRFVQVGETIWDKVNHWRLPSSIFHGKKSFRGTWRSIFLAEVFLKSFIYLRTNAWFRTVFIIIIFISTSAIFSYVKIIFSEVFYFFLWMWCVIG